MARRSPFTLPSHRSLWEKAPPLSRKREIQIVAIFQLSFRIALMVENEGYYLLGTWIMICTTYSDLINMTRNANNLFEQHKHWIFSEHYNSVGIPVNERTRASRPKVFMEMCLFDCHWDVYISKWIVRKKSINSCIYIDRSTEADLKLLTCTIVAQQRNTMPSHSEFQCHTRFKQSEMIWRTNDSLV